MTDTGFDASVLSEFRARLVDGDGAQQLLERMLERLRAQGLLVPGGRQRTDASCVVAAVRELNRLELVTKTMRAALEAWRLVAQVMGSEPYTSAKRVFWVVDSGSSHRDAASVRRLAADWPRAQLVHTPIHSSWSNQVETYLSICQRKVLTPNDFADLAAVEQRLLAFQRRYEQSAKPFQWKFTRADLAQLLKRLAAKTDLPPAA